MGKMGMPPSHGKGGPTKPGVGVPARQGPVAQMAAQVAAVANYSKKIQENKICAASLACLAAALTAAAEESSDIHTDTATLHLLRTRAHQPGLSATELRCVLRRATAYRWEGDLLRRVMADGNIKLVPPPAARDQLITAVHGSNGHFGVRRTTAMLLYSYWWPGVHVDVARVLKSCHVCDRARACFNLRAAQLSPLPVSGLFYCWGVDLAGPLPRTHRGNEYLMVCIEHLTKHVELVPIPDRLANTTAYHFNHQVLGRYGASAKVVTDGGWEFKGEFADLLRRNLIDHRVTSPHHPQADGLAERAVQTFNALMGKCGRVMAENVCNLAPCHLPDIDPTIDHTLARPAIDFPCSICKSPSEADNMLVCDGCGKGYHTFCLTPPMAAVPPDTRLCLGCHATGVSVDEVQQRAHTIAQQPAPPPLREVCTTKPRFKGQQHHPPQPHGRLEHQAHMHELCCCCLVTSQFGCAHLPERGRGRLLSDGVSTLLHLIHADTCGMTA
ncbi:hypothetical protein QJQ45_004389 [Haematococcus lacustris]|nr:hypothetical protein QJQ45_004389 [Haematococcus lacustris]